MTPPACTDAVVVPPSFGSGVIDASVTGARATSWAVDLSRLVRPRIAVMVLATVVSAYWLTAGRPESIAALGVLLVGTALVAASSSIANQILEHDTDRAMERTASRPIAAGRLSVREAWWFAAATLVVGTVAVWAGAGTGGTIAALATWLLYVLVYTLLQLPVGRALDRLGARRVGAALHRNANVSLLQSRRVVHAVARHARHEALLHQALHD
jgi:hypothetical protein